MTDCSYETPESRWGACDGGHPCTRRGLTECDGCGQIFCPYHIKVCDRCKSLYCFAPGESRCFTDHTCVPLTSKAGDAMESIASLILGRPLCR